jgi:hypothetical protein
MPNALPASCRVKGEGLSDFQRPDDFQPSCQGLVGDLTIAFIVDFFLLPIFFKDAMRYLLSRRQ